MCDLAGCWATMRQQSPDACCRPERLSLKSFHRKSFSSLGAENCFCPHPARENSAADPVKLECLSRANKWPLAAVEMEIWNSVAGRSEDNALRDPNRPSAAS